MKKLITDFSESLEDYLEAIYLLGGQNVRSVDLANHLGVSKASVNHAIHQLSMNELVEKAPYGDIHLTSQGMDFSVRILRKHQVIKQFLTDILGVDDSTAELEACGIEHNISDDTLNRLISLIESKKTSTE
jgi:DtxR family transcriptional regulator, Mn-dependent transcriptional regulator